MQEIITMLLTYGLPLLLLLFVVGIVGYVFSLRRIVPTNVVHIVQRGDKTVSYGVGKGSNVYYEFPKWLPKIGVEVFFGGSKIDKNVSNPDNLEFSLIVAV